MAGKAQLIDTQRLKPLDEQMTGDPFAQSKFQAFLEKRLRDRERQQYGNDEEERPEIMDKARQVLAAHGIEESAVPVVEFHLSKHVGNGDGGRGNEDRHHPPPAFRPLQYTREQGQVAGKIEILRWRGRDELVRERGSGRRDRDYRNYRNYRSYRLCGLWYLRWRVCGQTSRG
jgi:hypothetical protein